MRKVIVFAPVALIAAPISGRIQAAPPTKVKARGARKRPAKYRAIPDRFGPSAKLDGRAVCGPSVTPQS
jgi:hypothetical protein